MANNYTWYFYQKTRLPKYVLCVVWDFKFTARQGWAVFGPLGIPPTSSPYLPPMYGSTYRIAVEHNKHVSSLPLGRIQSTCDRGERWQGQPLGEGTQEGSFNSIFRSSPSLRDKMGELASSLQLALILPATWAGESLLCYLRCSRARLGLLRDVLVVVVVVVVLLGNIFLLLSRQPPTIFFKKKNNKN